MGLCVSAWGRAALGIFILVVCVHAGPSEASKRSYLRSIVGASGENSNSVLVSAPRQLYSGADRHERSAPERSSSSGQTTVVQQSSTSQVHVATTDDETDDGTGDDETGDDETNDTWLDENTEDALERHDPTLDERDQVGDSIFLFSVQSNNVFSSSVEVTTTYTTTPKQIDGDEGSEEGTPSHHHYGS
eukprot:Nitzschia sp. Nitz4//scaffold219_size35776//13509//14153//NITZ4_007821-RA/size35776-snap-gene-0.63-mRNA-1//1//CDS//3329542311//4348//frame0